MFLCLLYSSTLFAQDDPPEKVIESAAEGVNLEQLSDQLQQLRMQPLNLNNCTVDEMIIPGLFTNEMAEALSAHRNRYGDLLCIEELQSINVFTDDVIRQIRPYCTVTPKAVLHQYSFHSIMHASKNSLLVRTSRSFNTGSAEIPQGDPYKLNASWKMLAGNYINIGISAEKDPGEAWMYKDRLPLFDFVSFHLFVRPAGHIKAVAIGDYQISCGQGLVSWSGFSYGKGPEVISIRKIAPVIKPYSSFSEYGFLRGAAVSISANKYEFTTWLSRRKIDTPELYDTDGDVVFHTIRTDGYHRNEKEIELSKNIRQDIAGLNIRYINHSCMHEFTLQSVQYNRVRIRGDEPSQIFDGEGKSFTNASYAYAWTHRNINIFGETALSENEKFAVLNGIIINTDTRVAVSLLHRYFAPGYASYNANPFRENSQVNNEQGIFGGLLFQLSKQWKMQAYADFFSFPWLRYEVDAPVHGSEWLYQLTYTPTRTAELYMRFRQQNKPENISGEYVGIKKQMEVTRNNFRVNASLKLNRNFSLQCRGEWVRVKKDNSDPSQGWLLFQEIDLKPMGKPWAVTVRYALFSAPDYDTRVYAYVQDIPGSFSIPAYYNNGESWYLLLRLRLRKGLDCWLRWSVVSKYGEPEDKVVPSKDQLGSTQFRWTF